MNKTTTRIQSSFIFFIPTSGLSIDIFHQLIRPAMLDGFESIQAGQQVNALRNKNLIVDLSIYYDPLLLKALFVTHRMLQNNIVVLATVGYSEFKAQHYTEQVFYI